MSKLTPLLETIFMNHGGTPEHWRVSSKVINEKAEESKHFVAFIKTKLKELDVEVQSMALDLIDFLMDEGKMPLFNQVSSKDFLMTLINILKNRGASVIQEKILYLLKKWGIKFEKHKDIIPTFSDIYEQLKKSNTVFPSMTTPPYYRFLYTKEELEMKNNNNINSSKGNSFGNSTGSNLRNSAEGSKSNEKAGYPVFENKNVRDFDENVESKDEKTVDYSYRNYINISPEKFANKYKKFVAELIVWMDNITLANETIENTDYKADIDEYLRSIIMAVRAAEKQLVGIIQAGFEEEDLMNICLTLNDDINKTLQRYECLKKKKKPEPFLTGFLLNESINPKFKVKKPEPKPAKQIIPKISGSGSSKQQSINKAGILVDLQNNNAVNSKTSNIPVKDVNDIFDLFSSSVKISDDNNANRANNVLNKSANIDNANKNIGNKNDFNPNNMIDLVTNLTQNQKAKQADNIIDLSQLANNNANANNLGINDVKISNEPQQNKKIVDLEELLSAAYSNTNNNNFQGNPQADNYINNPQNNQAGYSMPMYGLPSNAPINNQYQNPSLMNPSMMMPMPIVNPNNGQNYGFSPLGMDVNGNYINNQPNPMNNIPINNQGYPQVINYPNPSVNYPAPQQNFGNMGTMPNMPNVPNMANAPQQQQQHPNVQQHQVDSSYPDFFN